MAGTTLTLEHHVGKEKENGDLELSIVMPCLNEAETLLICIQKAQRSLEELGIAGEIVIADNGSTDGSQAIAAKVGARVINVEEKGYCSALRGGFSRRAVSTSSSATRTIVTTLLT